MATTLRILPLGGVGEIGKNMTVVEYGGKIVIVDVGLMFPSSEMHGVDLILPDWSYLRGREQDIVAIVLTHGHEDHVGALPYLLKEFEIPVIYGGRLTAGMVRSKLDEHKLDDAPVEALEPGEVVEAGPFEIEMVHVTHSIPDACAVLLSCKMGSVLFTGDYKFDQTPVDGPPADMARLSQIGDDGLLVLCGDSTNADRLGVTESESSVGPGLEHVFSRCTGRIIVTSFASNVHRVQQVIDAAANLNRKVVVVGRSMRKYLNVARNLDHADVPDGLLIPLNEINSFPDDELVVISTGSQGEPLSALTRMAYDNHRNVKLHEGDTVVFSATPVPGNEVAVNDTIDQLFKIGCNVITTKEAPIHTSGHGCAEELKMMINLTNPRYVVPVHGDYKRLALHTQLAQATGVDPDDIFRLEDGLALDIDDKGARVGERYQSDLVFVDGSNVGGEGATALDERVVMANDGVVTVAIALSLEDPREASEPTVVFRGVPFVDGEDKATLAVRAKLDEIISETDADVLLDGEAMSALMITELKKTLQREIKRRPVILPALIYV